MGTPKDEKHWSPKKHQPQYHLFKTTDNFVHMYTGHMYFSIFYALILKYAFIVLKDKKQILLICGTQTIVFIANKLICN